MAADDKMKATAAMLVYEFSVLRDYSCKGTGVHAAYSFVSAVAFPKSLMCPGFQYAQSP